MSYLDLARLMDKQEAETTKLARELTIKDMIGILNDPKSTPAEQSVAIKATQLLTEAETNYLNRTESKNADEDSNSNTALTPNEWLKRFAKDYFMGDL